MLCLYQQRARAQLDSFVSHRVSNMDIIFIHIIRIYNCVKALTKQNISELKFQKLQIKFIFQELLILPLFIVILCHRVLNKVKSTFFRKYVFISLPRVLWK